MANERSGNMRVSEMISQIKNRLNELEMGYFHKRANRQLVDGIKFLEMIRKPPYNRCTTVSELKKTISGERAKLKQQIADLDSSMPGHQFNFFEEKEELSEEEQKTLIKVKARITEEVKWLHKCLGMCANKDYFN